MPYIETAEQLTLPVVFLHGCVAFPAVPLNFELTDKQSEAAVQAAASANATVLLLPTSVDLLPNQVPKISALRKFGTVAKIKQMLHSPEGSTRIIAEGYSRCVITEFHDRDSFTEADVICKVIQLTDNGGIRGEAFQRELVQTLKDLLSVLPSGSENLVQTAAAIRNPGMLADFIASQILVRLDDKISVLECVDPFRRCMLLLELLDEEADLMETEARIRDKVNDRMNRNQREYYLREQLKAVQEELGEGATDSAEYETMIRNGKLPKEVEAKLLKENSRLAKTPFGSAEATVLANYLDTCLDIPWVKSTKDKMDVKAVEKVLNADHFGLEKVKERIVEYIAAKQMNPELKNQILCLVGAPGVGKTSIAASIARALNRKYVRISLGGVRDEADIRGHRKTYIGAMPGRIIAALTQAKVKNPLILLDEIDKLTADSHGDPTSALLEVLDSEQNKNFRDHFVELPYDLSDCMFIATANYQDLIPKPLQDRMEIIHLDIYTRQEKLEIAKRYLVPKQWKRHGLDKKTLKITDEAILEIIDFYTAEAGVRNLERTLATLCRKVDKQILETADKKNAKILIDKEDVKTYLGAEKRFPESVGDADEIGCVNGLAYTEVGGELLKVEAAAWDGDGKVETTGSLGNVMQESSRIAVSVVRSVAKDYGIPADFHKTKDIHIHFPDGATPKDGPSAGVTMVTALVSVLSGRPVRKEIAMTGEISLRGKVLPIGGLREKTMAAYQAGVRTVLIPKENLRDLEKLDPVAREHLNIVPCTLISEVLDAALLPMVPQNSVAEKINSEKSDHSIQEEAIAASITVSDNDAERNPVCP